jgi:hypothetical protein
VELAQRFSTSSEGVSATAATSFRDSFNYGSRTVANHEQGREIFFSKSVPTSNPFIVLRAKLLKDFF